MANRSEDSSGARLRLLQAAGEIFAEHGFRQTTVRDIVERAGVNVAAVNYHFGDKLALYGQVLRFGLEAATEKYPIGQSPGAEGDERLTAFVSSFLRRLMEDGVPAWHGRLMAREMADPTPGIIELLVQTHIRQQSQTLFSVVAELLGPRASPERIRDCAFSVVGQILFYRHCQHTIRLIAPEQRFDPPEIARIAEHIARFSLGGVEATREEKFPPGRVAARSTSASAATARGPHDKARPARPKRLRPEPT